MALTFGPLFDFGANPVDPALATHTIPSAMGTADGAGNMSAVGPGDVVAIESGSRGLLELHNFHGTADEPIIFVNDGGVVNIDSGSGYAGVDIRECSHIRVTGSGAAGGGGRSVGAAFDDGDQDAGIVVSSPGVERGIAYQFYTGLLAALGPDVFIDIEVDHVESDAQLKSGVHAISQDVGTAADTLRGLHLHHLLLRNGDLAGTDGEGFYVGATNPGDQHRIEDVRIHHCLVDGQQRDGIQLTSCPRGASIHHNVVRRVGTSEESGHGFGLIIQDLSRADVYSNWIEEAARHGMYIRGEAGTRIFNNVVVRSGAIHADGDGMNVTDSQHGVVHPVGPVYAWNNTFVDSARDGINPSASLVATNNIAVGSGVADIDSGGTQSNNLTSDPGFVDAASDDYRLAEGSDAIGGGADLSISSFDSFDAPDDGLVGMAWDGTHLWVLDAPPTGGSATLYKLDPHDGTVVNSYPVPHDYEHGIGAHSLGFDGTHLWLRRIEMGEFNQIFDETTELVKIDPADGSEVGAIATPNTTIRSIAWDGTNLWVFNDWSFDVEVRDPTNAAILDAWNAVDGFGLFSSFNTLLWIGEYLWGADLDSDIVRQYDMTDPDNPEVLLQLDTPEAWNVQLGASDGSRLWVGGLSHDTIYHRRLEAHQDFYGYNRPTGEWDIGAHQFGAEEQGGDGGGGIEPTFANDFEGGTDEELITDANSGGDSGDPFFLVAQTAVYDSARSAHGSISARLNQGEFSGRLRWETEFATAGWWRGYIWIPSIATNRILQAGTDGVDTFAAEMVSDGTFRIRDATGVLVTSTEQYATGQWIRVEARVTVGSPGSAEFRFYNDPESTTPTETISTPVAFSDGLGWVDTMDFTSSVEVWWDSVAVSDTDWLGPVEGDGGGNGEEPEPEPVIEGLAFTQAEIDSLPTSGGAWDDFVSFTNSDAGTPDLTDQNSMTSRNVMLQALRWRIDGGGVGVSAIESKLLGFPGDEDVDSLGVFRQMFNIAVAVDLIDMDIDSETVTNAEGSTVTYREWLEEMITKTVGDHGRWFSIRNTAAGYSGARASLSNYGAYARASYVALAFLVGTTAQQEEAVASLRQMLGTDMGQTGFEPTSVWSSSWVPGSSFPDPQIGILPESDGFPYGGLIHEDASRQTSEGGSSGPNFDSAPAQSWGVSYSMECWDGLITSAIIVAHNGYPEIYEEADAALDRALIRLAAEGNLNSASYTRWNFMDNVLIWNKIYDAGYPEVSQVNGARFAGQPEYLLSGDWPLGVFAAPPEPIEYVETGLEVEIAFGVEAFDVGADEIPPEIADVRVSLSVDATADYFTGGGGGGSAFADDFNRASLGSDWVSAASGSWTIEGNALANETGFTQATKYATDADTDEHFSEFAIGQWATDANFGPWAGPAVMMPDWVSGSLSSQADFYVMLLARMPVSELSIRRKDNLSSGQTIMGGTESVTAAPGDRFRLEVEGTDLVGYKNDVEVIRRAMSLLPLEVGGRGMGALATQNVGLRFDNWEGGDVGAGAGPAIAEYDEIGLDVVASFGIEAVDTFVPAPSEEYVETDLDVELAMFVAVTDVREMAPESVSIEIEFITEAIDDREMAPESVSIEIEFTAEATDARAMEPQVVNAGFSVAVEAIDAVHGSEVVEASAVFTTEAAVAAEMAELAEVWALFATDTFSDHDLALQLVDVTTTLTVTATDSREMEPEVVAVATTLTVTATDAREMVPEEVGVEVGFSVASEDEVVGLVLADTAMAVSIEATDVAQFTEVPEAAVSVEVGAADTARLADDPAAAVAFGITASDLLAATEVADTGFTVFTEAMVTGAGALQMGEVLVTIGVEAIESVTAVELGEVVAGFSIDAIDGRVLVESVEVGVSIGAEAVDDLATAEVVDLTAFFSVEAELVGAAIERIDAVIAVETEAIDDLTMGEVTDLAMVVSPEASDEARWTENVGAVLVVGVEADGLLRGQERPETQVWIAVAADSAHAMDERADLGLSVSTEAIESAFAIEMVDVSVGTTVEAIDLAEWAEVVSIGVEFGADLAVGVGATEEVSVSVATTTSALDRARLDERPESEVVFDVEMSEVHWQVERPTVSVAVSVEAVTAEAAVDLVDVSIQLSADLATVFWPFYVPEISDVVGDTPTLQGVVPRTPVLHDVKPGSRS